MLCSEAVRGRKKVVHGEVRGTLGAPPRGKPAKSFPNILKLKRGSDLAPLALDTYILKKTHEMMPGLCWAFLVTGTARELWVRRWAPPSLQCQWPCGMGQSHFLGSCLAFPSTLLLGGDDPHSVGGELQAPRDQLWPLAAEEGWAFLTASASLTGEVWGLREVIWLHYLYLGPCFFWTQFVSCIFHVQGCLFFPTFLSSQQQLKSFPLFSHFIRDFKTF